MVGRLPPIEGVLAYDRDIPVDVKGLRAEQAAAAAIAEAAAETAATEAAVAEAADIEAEDAGTSPVIQ